MYACIAGYEHGDAPQHRKTKIAERAKHQYESNAESLPSKSVEIVSEGSTISARPPVRTTFILTEPQVRLLLKSPSKVFDQL